MQPSIFFSSGFAIEVRISITSPDEAFSGVLDTGIRKYSLLGVVMQVVMGVLQERVIGKGQPPFAVGFESAFLEAAIDETGNAGFHDHVVRMGILA